MGRLCPIKPLLRQLGDNAYRGSPALISGEPRELRYIALGAAHSLLQCVSPDVAQSGHDSRVAQCPLSGVKRTSFPDDATSAFDPKRHRSDCNPAVQQPLALTLGVRPDPQGSCKAA